MTRIECGERLCYFLVPGTPVPQPRVNRFGKVPARHPIHRWREKVEWVARQAWAGRPPIDFPVVLEIGFRFPRPTFSTWKKKHAGVHQHVTRPDLSNLLKGLEDALNGVLWRDDSLVVKEILEKWIGGYNAAAGTRIAAYRAEMRETDDKEQENSRCDPPLGADDRW